jgi:hypothetical protein
MEIIVLLMTLYWVVELGLNLMKSIICNKQSNPHFVISYNHFDSKYLIKDLGNGAGVFFKLKSIFKLTSNSMINIGASFLIVQLDAECLKIKIISHSFKSQTLSFNSFDSVVIGRDKSCTIPIDDELLSRIHCSLVFQDEFWVVKDGGVNASDNWDHSTNGTWIYISTETEISDNMQIKTADTIFNVNIFNI